MRDGTFQGGNFKAVLEEKTREAESIIAAYLPKEEGFAKELAKAMNYSMTAGGKGFVRCFY